MMGPSGARRSSLYLRMRTSGMGFSILPKNRLRNSPQIVENWTLAPFFEMILDDERPGGRGNDDVFQRLHQASLRIRLERHNINVGW